MVKSAIATVGTYLSLVTIVTTGNGIFAMVIGIAAIITTVIVGIAMVVSSVIFSVTVGIECVWDSVAILIAIITIVW